MSRKDRKSNPDLTAEWRMEQDQIKNGQNPNPTPYQFSNNNFDNSYPYYQQPQQNIPPYNAPKPGADYYGFDNKKETSNVQNEQNKSRVKQNQKKEDDIEKQYRSAQRKRYFLRGLLILINLGLLSYVCLSVVGIIFDSQGNNEKNIDAYITLKGKNKKDSQKIYDRLLDEKEVSTFNDYGILGDDLYLSNYSLKNTSSFQEFYFSRIDNVKDNEDFYWARMEKLNFSNFEPGDYALTTNLANKYPLKYNGNSSIYQTFYSLPNSSGERREITIKGNKVSPIFLISVNVITELPEFWYDVVYYADRDSEIPNIDRITSKVAYKDEGMQSVYLTNANYAIDLSGTDNFSSKYTALEGFTVDDNNNFIKEIGGYLTGANSLVDDKSSVLNSIYKNDHLGKKVFTLKNDDNIDIKTDNINKILSAK